MEKTQPPSKEDLTQGDVTHPQETSASEHLDGGGTALFIRRPVFSLVISLLIVVAGLAGIYGAEIRELPDVDRPVITISTDFSGASPETIDRELTAVVEGAVARVAGVASISSTSSFGRSRVTVEFTDNTDLSVAASDVRDSLRQGHQQSSGQCRRAAHCQSRREF